MAELNSIRTFDISEGNSVFVCDSVNAEPEACTIDTDEAGNIRAWFYVDIGLGRVYANPPFVCVGQDGEYNMSAANRIKNAYGEAAATLFTTTRDGL